MNSPASTPSAPGPFAACTHNFEARDRLFCCDIWCPDEPGARPQIATTALLASNFNALPFTESISPPERRSRHRSSRTETASLPSDPRAAAR